MDKQVHMHKQGFPRHNQDNIRAYSPLVRRKLLIVLINTVGKKDMDTNEEKTLSFSWVAMNGTVSCVQRLGFSTLI